MTDLKIRFPNNWHPRPYQENIWQYLKGGGKRSVLRWFRRSGKDEVFLHHTACAAHERVGNYWYMLPQYSQARKSMWDAINPHTGKKRLDDVFPEEAIAGVNNQEMQIMLKCGSTFQLMGSDNYDSLVGSPPVGLTFSEYALSAPSAWGYLRPILLENGGWAAFNSTPRGRNHFAELCKLAEKSEDWFYEALTVDDTEVFTKEEMAQELAEMQAEHGEEYGKSLWLQEYYVSFDAAMPGSIFGEWLDRARTEGRIGNVEVGAGPVHTAWDLGHTDATAIWFYQIVMGEIHVIDYHESNLKDIPWYADVLRGKPRYDDSASIKELKKRTRNYKYGTHWLPHDARARTLASGGKSIQQQMINEDVGRIVIAKRLDHVDGIQAARATIPRCWFDEERCEKGLEALRAYRYEWDADKKTFNSRPEHDWASHGASAFRTLSLSWRAPKENNGVIESKMESNVIPGTFGELKKNHFKRMRNLRASL